MSTQYPGGFITKSPVAPTSSAASGIWTVDQALQYVKAGTWPAPPSPYIEDVFSTYLYTGNSSTQTITNNINLSAYGGLVWCKDRTTIDNHFLSDTAQGTGKDLASNGTFAATTQTGITAFNTTGFTLGNIANANTSTRSYVSWTFRKQAKFFDIVTYTGTGASVNISHALGTTPGFLIIKKTSGTGNWPVFARDGTSASKYTYSYFNTSSGLNLTSGASFVNEPAENNGVITSTTFNPNSLSGSAVVGNVNNINDSGATYIAYLFAHNAGGFSASGTGSTNGISCGAFTADGSGNATVDLGYEPQWIMLKRNDGTQAWVLLDNMRGLPVSGSGVYLAPNSDGAEGSLGWPNITATGFTATTLSSGAVYIYIAIRRGPMKTPTVGTSVLGITSRSGTAANATVTGLNAVDFMLTKMTSGTASNPWVNRLTANNYMSPTASAVQTTNATSYQTNPWDVQNGVKVGTGAVGSLTNLSGGTYINYLFNRAPLFFDIVCYTGTGVATTVAHNLGTAPLFYIVKCRSNSAAWYAYSQTVGATYYIQASNNNAAANDVNFWNNTAPTSSVFSVNTDAAVNLSARTYIAYLFATCPGVSKVGSYTGTAALQTIDCGFTTGARWIMIKRTDSAGDWYVYDSTRGISSGTDPYFLWTQAGAEVTGTDYVDTDTTGFKVTASAPITLNASGGTYIFLAIA